MNGDAPAPKPPAFRKPPPPVAIVLRADIGVDAVSIRAWVAHMRALGHDDLAAAAEEAESITVRRRWPKADTPLPRIPVDFKKRAAGS